MVELKSLFILFYLQDMLEVSIFDF